MALLLCGVGGVGCAAASLLWCLVDISAAVVDAHTNKLLGTSTADVSSNATVVNCCIFSAQPPSVELEYSQRWLNLTKVGCSIFTAMQTSAV